MRTPIHFRVAVLATALMQWIAIAISQESSSQSAMTLEEIRRIVTMDEASMRLQHFMEDNRLSEETVSDCLIAIVGEWDGKDAQTVEYIRAKAAIEQMGEMRLSGSVCLLKGLVTNDLSYSFQSVAIRSIIQIGDDEALEFATAVSRGDIKLGAYYKRYMYDKMLIEIMGFGGGISSKKTITARLKYMDFMISDPDREGKLKRIQEFDVRWSKLSPDYVQRVERKNFIKEIKPRVSAELSQYLEKEAKGFE